MVDKILLCCDLDRTVLPNGPQAESPLARPLFHAITRRKEITLVYVSGRDKTLLQEAIREFRIPTPDYAIGDVGTTIYRIQEGDWQVWKNWQREIDRDWQGLSHAGLCALLRDISELTLQEPAKQNLHKLSFYTPSDINKETLTADVNRRLQDKGVKATLVWSVDEVKDIGLFDILPASASKLHAIRFLAAELGFAQENILFAGDSGNDLPVLVSSIKSVLVNNALPAVKEEAQALAEQNRTSQRLYLANGKFHDLNGNYSAGILEGLTHYFPDTTAWLKAEITRLSHSATIH